MEAERGLAGALDQKKALSGILLIKQALDGIWFLLSDVRIVRPPPHTHAQLIHPY